MNQRIGDGHFSMKVAISCRKLHQNIAARSLPRALPRSRARRATSGRSPTASRPSCARSGSRSRRTMRARRIGSNAGNLLCRLPGRADGGTPLFLCAHLDTVPPQGPLEPVVGEDGIVRNAGGTILGADNKSARRGDDRGGAAASSRSGVPHAGVELVFTPKEEVGLLGAGAFDHTRLEARARLRLRPGGADRRRDHGRAVPAHDARRASTAGRRTRAWSRRRAARRSRRPRARSPTSGSAGSTRRRPRTSA